MRVWTRREFLGLLPLPALIPSEQAKAATRRGREVRVLGEGWRFLADQDQKGVQRDWTQFIPKEAQAITVPNLWSGKDISGQGVGWYWCPLSLPSDWNGQHIRLRFEAVAERAEVWLNGKRLGDHTGGATPFEFNITSIGRLGVINTLAIRVEGDTRAGAGIWQAVLLLAHDEAYLDDLFPQGNITGNLTVPTILLNTSDKTGDALLEARLVAANEPTRTLKSTRQNLHIVPGRNLTTLITSLRGKALTLWSPEFPQLYTLQLIFRQEKDILDTHAVSFGFREVEVRERTLLLNRQALKPVLAPWKQPQPLLLAGPDNLPRLREEIRRLKEAGINLLQIAAPHPTLLHLTDEEGLPVLVGPAHTGPAAPEELRALIQRDRAHPSIVGWNLEGLPPETVTALRPLDPTRFWRVGTKGNLRLAPPGLQETPLVAPPDGLS